MKILIAGAGAGKTTNLAQRIKQRYDESSEAKNIFCIAYTNNAVDNINLRLKNVFDGQVPSLIHVRTIHSFLFQEIIRPYYYLLFNKSFDRFSFRNKGNDNRYYNKIFNDLEDKRILHVDAATQRAYWVLVKKTGDNSKIKKLRKLIQESFADYCGSIFIDEAQDIDKNTYEILKMLHDIGIYVDLVGDPKQDLRGHGCLRKLMEDFRDDVIYENKCYRCPETILKISNSIVPDSEKQQSGIDYGTIRVLFESDQDNLKEIIDSHQYDLKYIYKKNNLINTHDSETSSLNDSLAELLEEIMPRYFPNIQSSGLRMNRAAYYVANRFIEDYDSGVTLETSIRSIFPSNIRKSEYGKIASLLKTRSLNLNVTNPLVVSSIEKIKGCEGRNCLFILTPDLAAYLFGNKKEDNKTKCALYVGLTRALENLTILVTKETENKYSSKCILEHLNYLISQT